MNLALYVFVFCFNEASSSVTSFKIFLVNCLSWVLIEGHPKKKLFAVTLPRFFRWVGRKVKMHVVFFLYDYCCCLLFVF